MSPSPTDTRPSHATGLEPALLAADHWSLWRTLARGLAHTLANAAQMLAIDPPPARARAEAAERVTLAAARLADLNRPGEGGPTLVADVLDDVQALQRLQAGFPSTELVLDVANDLPAARLAAPELAHVLLALVTNAKQAAVPEPARIRVRARAVGGGVELDVEDDGPGLPAGAEDYAFAAGVTTRPDALGLGLHVGRALARGAGGDLVAGPGRACFRLHVPAWRSTR